MEYAVRAFEELDAKYVELAQDQDIFASGESPNDLVSLTWQDGVIGLLVHASSFTPSFFDLKSGIAGEVLQKLTQYNAPTAFVMGDLTQFDVRIQELVHDHRRHQTIRFFEEQVPATEWLANRV